MHHKLRVRRPWPVLRLAKDALNMTVPPLGAYDEGSDHEDDRPELLSFAAPRRWRVRTEDPRSGEAREDQIVDRFFVEDMPMLLNAQ